MTKEKFAQILLSRFSALDDSGRYHLISCLVLASEELQEQAGEDRIEDEKDFAEWAITIMEGLFPEEIGDVMSLDEWNIDEY